MNLRDKAAIVGVGATELSPNSGRSELRLCLEAIRAALDDAGLTSRDVDGFVTFAQDDNVENEVARCLRIPDLKYFGRVGMGGGAVGGVILQAAMAVATGQAKVVVCWRAMNERSKYRFSDPAVLMRTMPGAASTSMYAWQGLQTAASYAAIGMRRYMHETGASYEDFGRMAIAIHGHAATNPEARFFGKPITMEDYLASRMVSDPFRKLDCCQESDGGVAFIVTSAALARDLRNRPALIRGAVQASNAATSPLSSYYRRDISPREEVKLAAARLYTAAGLGPSDIQTAILYDHFSPCLLPALEGYGFCADGEAKEFIRDDNISLGGRLPVNTNGGQTGAGYMHGMNGVIEAVRQIRGTAANQVAGAENVLVTAVNGAPTSAALISR